MVSNLEIIDFFVHSFKGNLIKVAEFKNIFMRDFKILNLT